MPLTPPNVGTAANNGTGDPLRLAFQKLIASDSYLKTYIDNLLQGLKWKQKVDVATTGNITLSGEQTIDGVLTSASRVLVKDQTNATENGIYISGATWVRAEDADTGEELVNATVSVVSGTENANTNWTSNAESITLGTTDVVWVDFSNISSGVSFEQLQIEIQGLEDELRGGYTGSMQDLKNLIDAFVGDVTQAYVDEQDAATLQAAKDYTDANSGSGEVHTETEKVWRTGDSQIFTVTDSSKTLSVYVNGDKLSRERRAEDLVIGEEYKILVVGNTDFTLLGASANTAGTVFTATGAAPDGETGRVESEWKINNATSIIVLIPLADGDNIAIVGSATATAIEDDTKIAKTANITGVWTGTQVDYDAITTKDATTLYFIQ